MKKKILFVNESLACAGGEKSLLNLLSVIDYSKYEVDLQLFSYGNEWDKLINENVNLLPRVEYFQMLGRPLSKELGSLYKTKSLKRFCARIKYAYYMRFGKRKKIPELACKFWQYHSANIPVVTKKYDVAIGYAQGLPTFYVVDKVNADRKLCWVNAYYRLSGDFRQFVLSKFQKINYIVSASQQARDVLMENFEVVEGKFKVFYDLLSPHMVTEMSAEPVKFKVDNACLTLMTLGRLQQYAKGMDILLETAKLLRDKGVNYKWYVLGKGDYRPYMECYIRDNNLQENLLLLGVKPNPYPYLKQADIYVQTSREEGFGIAIAEARFLNIPIISTPFSTIGLQIKNNVNGIITTFEPTDIANEIINLSNNKELLEKIKSSLREAERPVDQLTEFYNMIEK